MASPTSPAFIDDVLVQWGDRLFYPGNRIVQQRTPRMSISARDQAAAIRQRIEATVTRRATQVIVKVMGGGRGMKAIALHLRYISHAGQLAFEDDRGVVRRGKEALHDLAEQWRLGGSLIREVSSRREAVNLVLSMPYGTNPLSVLQATREFARIELRGHRYVMVLHEHQENPHVHLSARAESMTGQMLRPYKADLYRWRETFAEQLRALGVDAEATRQATRIETRQFEHLWQSQARKNGRLKDEPDTTKSGDALMRSRNNAMLAWAHIAAALLASEWAEDRELAQRIRLFILGTAYSKKHRQHRDHNEPVRQPSRQRDHQLTRERAGPEITR